MAENNRMRKNQKMFLSYTPEVENVATPLLAWSNFWDFSKTSRVSAQSAAKMKESIYFSHKPL